MFLTFSLLAVCALFCIQTAQAFSLSSLTQGVKDFGKQALKASGAMNLETADLENMARSTASTDVAFTVMVYANGESSGGMCVYDDGSASGVCLFVP